MDAELRVPTARHDHLGTVVAAELRHDEGLLAQLRDPGIRAGLQCASCDAPVQFVDATVRARHFRHTADATCAWGPESIRHLAIKDAFVRAFRFWQREGWALEVMAEHPRQQDRLWQADVACTVTRPDGTVRRMMVEVQQSWQTPEDTARRTELRHADGWDVLWVHYNPGNPVAPRWLRDAAPAVGLDVDSQGSIRIASGYLEHGVRTQSEMPPFRDPGPAVEDPVAIEYWDTGPESLPLFAHRWLCSEGFLTDPIEGRVGLAWTRPPDEAPVPADIYVLVDTYDAYGWRKDEEDTRRRQEAERQQTERAGQERAAEQRRLEMTAVLGPLYRLLRIVPPRPAIYPAGCFTCGVHIAAGQAAAMMRNELTSNQWRLICDRCSELLAMDQLGR